MAEHFSAQEQHELSLINADENHVAFFRMWTRKEAYAKAVEKGLHIDLSCFSVSSQCETKIAMANWYLQEFWLDSETVGTVAVYGNNQKSPDSIGIRIHLKQYNYS